MNKKNLLIGVASTSLAVLISHLVTKSHDYKKFNYYFDEQRKINDVELNNIVDVISEGKRELQNRVNLLSKKLYLIQEINLLDIIKYIDTEDLITSKNKLIIENIENLLDTFYKSEDKQEINDIHNKLRSLKNKNNEQNFYEESLQELIKKLSNNNNE